MNSKGGPLIRRISSYTRNTVRHSYPFGWHPSDWLVPYHEGRAVVHHSHTIPTDHSLCGPIIFCCRRSAGVYAELYPYTQAARSAWRPTEASQIISWIDAGVPLVNIVFCHPHPPNGLFLISMSSRDARGALRKEISLETLAPHAKAL